MKLEFGINQRSSSLHSSSRLFLNRCDVVRFERGRNRGNGPSIWGVAPFLPVAQPTRRQRIVLSAYKRKHGCFIFHGDKLPWELWKEADIWAHKWGSYDYYRVSFRLIFDYLGHFDWLNRLNWLQYSLAEAGWKTPYALHSLIGWYHSSSLNYTLCHILEFYSSKNKEC